MKSGRRKGEPRDHVLIIPGRRFLCKRQPGQTKQATRISSVIPAATPKVMARTKSNLKNKTQNEMMNGAKGNDGPTNEANYLRVFRRRIGMCRRRCN